MDPLNDLRADIQAVGPVERARAAMERAEAAEEHQREVARYERAAAGEAVMMRQAAEERVQLLTQGHTNRELEAYNREREQRRQGRIRELEAELGRLDPSRRGTAARFAEYGSAERPEVRIARADGSFAVLGPRETPDPAGMPPPLPEPRGRRFMQEEIRRYEQRCEREASAGRQAEIDRLEAEVSRAREYEEATGWARRTYDVDFRFE